MARTATYRLPWPPSVNNYIKRGRNVSYMTSKGREFREDVRQIVDELEPAPMLGRLAVHLELIRPSKRRIDIDNYCKAAIDALQHAGVFADDEQIDELRVTRLHVESPGCCDVTITEIDP